ncbi:MAG: phytanoyl-CoA dioxygenase family protein [Planctomycetota bacterium]
MPVLDADQIRQFRQDGYLLFDPKIPESVVDGVVSDLDGKYDQPLNSDGVLPPCRIQDAWKISKNAHQIAVWPRILDALRELYQREPKPFQTLNFPCGTIQNAHSDSVHFSSAPAGFMTGVWVGLETIDDDNGPVFYCPGSHKLPVFNMADVGTEPLEENYAQYEVFIKRVVEEFGLKKEFATMPKGHAFFWDANLIHGGSERRDLMRSRHSMVTHVYYEDCKYYTPMTSQGTSITWRDPQFIPREVEGIDRRKLGGIFRRGVKN